MERLFRSPMAALVLLAGLMPAVGLSADKDGLADKLPPLANKDVDFAGDIQPILQKFCLKCHGADKQLSGFRLDREGDALRGGDAGAAFEVGKSAESLLIKYVAGLDPDIVMPPDGEKLSADQVGLLRAWIDQGARWSADKPGESVRTTSDHWSFQPVRRPAEPAVQRAEWVRNPIDRFILSRLGSEEIAPSPEADRYTLIRRLSLDLLGLPPTPVEVAAFVNDTRPDAYEQLVDRLLSSPHFGERWGRHWLDLARYADSDGYEKDRGRPHAWRYRHWVIEAINRDLPFDQFTIEQIAGDLLPEATLDQKIATGFHRNTLTNTEGGVDQEEFRVAAVVDRVNTTSAVWLGLTMGCAQCHTHKYDPLTLREYYGLFAFFNQGQEVDIPAALADETEAYAKAKSAHDTAHEPYVAAIAAFEKDQLPARLAEWERTVDRSQLVGWRVLEAEKVASSGGAKFDRQPDGSYLVGGAAPAKDTYTITLKKTDLAGITAFRLEALPDTTLPAKGPGRAADGNFVLSEVRITATTGTAEPVRIALQRSIAGHSSEERPVAAAIDDRTETGWGIAPQFGKPHIAIFETAEGVGGPETTLTITLDQQHGTKHTIGRFRVSATTEARPVRLEGGLPDDLPPILAVAPPDRTPEQQAKLSAWYASIDPEMIKLRQAEAEHAARAPKPPETLAQTLTDVAKPRTTNIHIRGDFLRKGDEVAPHTPAVLPPLNRASGSPGHVANRLELARWLVSPENPLTSRVTVNRIWKHLFGQALVTTMDDFGTRGEKPSHPELLDWLASEFVAPATPTPPLRQGGQGGAGGASLRVADAGQLSAEEKAGPQSQSGVTPPAPPLQRRGEEARPWSVKRMIRLIVTSAAYRQSSRPRGDLVDRDPKNILLARQNRLRVEAEILRDLYLSASGLLNRAIGGRSVRPRQPAGIAELTYATGSKWVDSTGADLYRRGMYTWFQRTSPYPMLMTFDAPESNVTCARRERSNTPLQSLTLLNDPVFHECAQHLGRRLLQASQGDATARLRHGFELCLSRPPGSEELARLQQLYAEFQAAAAADPSSAGQLAGEPKPDEPQLAETAAAVALARVLLNLDEFVTRE